MNKLQLRGRALHNFLLNKRFMRCSLEGCRSNKLCEFTTDKEGKNSFSEFEMTGLLHTTKKNHKKGNFSVVEKIDPL